MKIAQGVMTSRFLLELRKENEYALMFFEYAPRVLLAHGKADMVVARSAEPFGLEDGGRTLVVPVPEGCPKFYAMKNETGGVTLMLAEEY